VGKAFLLRWSELLFGRAALKEATTPRQEAPKTMRRVINMNEKKTSKVVIAAVVFISVLAGIVFFSWMASNVQRTVAQPDIRAENVKAQQYVDWSGVRVKVTGTLFNYGDADGIVSVKVYTKWNNQIQDYEVKTVFVNAHTSKDVSADLDAPELSNFQYGIQIIEQRKA